MKRRISSLQSNERNEQTEATMVDTIKVEHKIQPFKYEKPPIREGRGKGMTYLTKTDVVGLSVQRVAEGGETNLHAHPGTDGIWFVLSGRARFYDGEDTVACELGPHEGVLVPHGVKYWFERAGEEDLEIMHITGQVPGAKNERLNFTPTLPQQEQRGINVYEYQAKRQV
jgi:mannose-6-phosphate isomerase-like protein (cupin superfamily)